MGVKPILGLITVPVNGPTGVCYRTVRMQDSSLQLGRTPLKEDSSRVRVASIPKTKLIWCIP